MNYVGIDLHKRYSVLCAPNRFAGLGVGPAWVALRTAGGIFSP